MPLWALNCDGNSIFQPEINIMSAPKRKSASQLQAQCDAWNRAHSVGTLVSFEEIRGRGETYRGKTASEADVTGGHTAIIFLEGKRGYVSLDHCTPVDGESTTCSVGPVDITVRHISGGYEASAPLQGVTATISKGQHVCTPEMAAKAVCGLLNLAPELLDRQQSGPELAAAFMHPGKPIDVEPV